ncbi:MAG: FAD:protein FMN transferase [Candidatus Cloacimonadota bacterium]|nr:FAD:protein FMN transferase [Candidatus Cloacimonadota bacterium]
MKKNIIQFIFILLLLAVGYFRITMENKKPLSKTEFVLGTFVTIDIKDHHKNNKTIIDSAFSIVSYYEKIFSSTIDISETNRINNSDSLVCSISAEMDTLLQKCRKVSTISQGAFDITTGKLVEKYDFVKGIMPTQEKISKTLPLVDYKNLKINNKKLIRQKQGIIIDLGGIAKGFIVDQVVKYLQNNGITNAAINAGGDLYLMENPEKENWKIGVRHPRLEGEIFGNVSLRNKAIVTSGDYEQFFFQDGKRIHHILDPATGFPANKTISVTTVANDACTADALCTAIFVLGPKKGIDLANSLPYVDALIIYQENSNNSSESQKKLTYKTSANFDQYNFEINGDLKNLTKKFLNTRNTLNPCGWSKDFHNE